MTNHCFACLGSRGYYVGRFATDGTYSSVWKPCRCVANPAPSPTPSAVKNSSRGASLDGPEGPELLAVIRSSTREVVVVRRGDLPVIEAGALYASRPSTLRTDHEQA